MSDNCPNCNASFIGDAIPDDIVHMYSGDTWRREVGIDGDRLGIYDGVVAYMCPDCQHLFPRGTSTWALEMFNKFKERQK